MHPTLLLLPLIPATPFPDVELELSPVSQVVPVNCLAEVAVTLSADTPSTVVAVDLILDWDPAELEFVQAINGDEAWLFAGFLNDPDGINDDVLDGDALFTALASPFAPLELPPDVLIVTFEFRVLADGDVGTLPSLGVFGETMVFGTTPGEPLRSTVSGPVTILAEPAPSMEISRVGFPSNPDVLLPGVTSGPVIGELWDPVIEHSSFLPAAILDLVLVSAAPTNISIPPYGTLLCEIPFLVDPFLATPGTPFAIPVPNNCAFVGLPVCTQGLSVDGIGTMLLTNALDLTIGAT